MTGTIATPRVAKIAMSLLSHMFFDVILSLEKENSNQVVFGKQLDIRKCMKNVQEFVLTRPYGIFHIEILDSIKRDLTKPMLTVSFQNFDTEIPGKVPMKYHIILDETYTTFEVYQSSIDGILIKIKV
jgi:hypothetical protein